MISNNALEWLNALTSVYVSKDLLLEKDSIERLILSHNFSQKKITFNHIPALWKIGEAKFGITTVNNIPAPALEENITNLITLNGNSFNINYDIYGLAYFMLTRAEEIGTKNLDEHNRFPAISSHAYKHNYLERPIVDEWFYILRNTCLQIWPDITLNTHKFQTLLSHDVDDISRYAFGSWKRMIRFSLEDFVALRFKSALVAPIIYYNSKYKLNKNDPYNTFDWIMDMSEKHKLKSAFYFICGRTDPSKDALYNFDAPIIKFILKNIANRGHEIGIHPSYKTYKDASKFNAEVDRFKKLMRKYNLLENNFGGRMHYLRWSMPQTLNLWNNSGATYDSTLGYAEKAGFRCGTCHEYPAFDIVNQKQLNVNIRPLIAMEITIMHKQYSGLGTGEVALKKFSTLKNECKKVNGNFTLLWHNSRLVEKENKKLYEDILKA